MSYLMESSQEAERLLAQEQLNASRARLLEAGLREGSFALDAGCGSGAVTAAMAKIVGSEGSVVGVDASAGRLAEARRHLHDHPNVLLHTARVQNLPFDTNTFDFSWSQYVLQYLPDPVQALAELLRVTKPGGRVAISEVDGAGLLNWPFPSELERGYRTLIDAAASKDFDLFIGRKVFSMMKTLGMSNVSVKVHPQYVVAGSASAPVLSDWELRFQVLEEVAAPRFGSAGAYRDFSKRFLELLADDASLKYAVQLVTVGTKL